jgi:hypothetical protein
MVAAVATTADPSQAQLQQELDESITRAIALRRPILTHLNADTTWLVQLPCPPDQPSPAGRAHFNILIDPWLSGPQSDVAAWFSTQWHAIPSSVATIAELEERLHDVEDIAQRVAASSRPPAKADPASKTSYIDAIAICHEFTDHCHEATLREVDPVVPVFATDKAADLIRSWHYFHRVYTTPPFGPNQPDWRLTSIPPLPDWVGISRVVTSGDALYYHSALLITAIPAAPSEGWPKDGVEAIVYSPHGIVPSDLAHLEAAKPPLKTLALLHGLHDVSLPRFQLNLGGHNGLKAHKTTRPRYWVASHDEQKKGGGLIGFILRRKVISLQETVEKAQEELAAQDGKMPVDMTDINFLEMQSGESLLME